jgi:hypothetical protein
MVVTFWNSLLNESKNFPFGRSRLQSVISSRWEWICCFILVFISSSLIKMSWKYSHDYESEDAGDYQDLALVDSGDEKLFNHRLKELLIEVSDEPDPWGEFCVDGLIQSSMPFPSIRIKNTGGVIPLPVVDPQAAQMIKEQAELAPFGKGTKTVTEKNIRDCWQWDVSEIIVEYPNCGHHHGICTEWSWGNVSWKLRRSISIKSKIFHCQTENKPVVRQIWLECLIFWPKKPRSRLPQRFSLPHFQQLYFYALGLNFVRHPHLMPWLSEAGGVVGNFRQMAAGNEEKSGDIEGRATSAQSLLESVKSMAKSTRFRFFSAAWIFLVATVAGSLCLLCIIRIWN